MLLYVQLVGIKWKIRDTCVEYSTLSIAVRGIGVWNGRQKWMHTFPTNISIVNYIQGTLHSL